ncbi:MAG: hypothetical protein QM489_01055 [Candidatus Izemoplasma sp.]
MILDLVKEYTENTETITEDFNGKKRYYIEGVFLQADIKNKNGRIYPSQVMESAVDKYVIEHINTGRALGELNHPFPARPDIDYEKTCIKIESLNREGSDWIGKALVTNSPKGAIVEGLLGDGVTMAVSSRALARSKQENGAFVIQPGMHICTPADVVYDPSAPKAFVEGIMENSRWIMKDGLFIESSLEMAREIINKTKSKDLPLAYEQLFNILVHK